MLHKAKEGAGLSLFKVLLAAEDGPSYFVKFRPDNGGNLFVKTFFDIPLQRPENLYCCTVALVVDVGDIYTHIKRLRILCYGLDVDLIAFAQGEGNNLFEELSLLLLFTLSTSIFLCFW